MDLLSPEIFILYKNKYRFKSYIGGIFTIILFILSILIFYYYLNQYLKITNNQKSLLIENNDESVIRIENITLIIEIDKEIYHDIDFNFKIYNFQTENCTNENLNINYDFIITNKFYYCYSTDLKENGLILNEGCLKKDNCIYQENLIDYYSLFKNKLKLYISYYYINITDMNKSIITKEVRDILYKAINFEFDYILLHEESSMFNDHIYNHTYYDLKSNRIETNSYQSIYIYIKFSHDIRIYKISYEKIYQTLKKIFYFINILYILISLKNNFLSDYYFMKYILIIHKKKIIELSVSINDMSINNTLRKLNDIDSNNIHVFDKYYTLINYLKYYLAYRYFKNSIQIKNFESIHKELIKLISIETILKSGHNIHENNDILNKFDFFNYCSFISINKKKKLHTLTGKILSLIYIIIFIFTVFSFLYFKKEDTSFNQAVNNSIKELVNFDIPIIVLLSDTQYREYEGFKYILNNNNYNYMNNETCNHIILDKIHKIYSDNITNSICYNLKDYMNNFYDIIKLHNNLTYNTYIMFKKPNIHNNYLIEDNLMKLENIKYNEFILKMSIIYKDEGLLYSYKYHEYFYNYEWGSYAGYDNNYTSIKLDNMYNNYYINSYKVVEAISDISPLVLIIKTILIIINKIFFDYYYMKYIFDDDNDNINFYNYMNYKLSISNNNSFELFYDMFRKNISFENIHSVFIKYDDKLNISDLDLINSHQSLYIQNKQYFKTKIGGILFIVYILLCVFSFFNIGWNCITRSNPKMSVSYEPYSKFDYINFTVDVPFSFKYPKNNRDYDNSNSTYSCNDNEFYYFYNTTIKNDSFLYECSNFNRGKTVLTNLDNKYFYFYIPEFFDFDENVLIHEEFKILNLFKFNYINPNTILSSDNYYYEGDKIYSESFGIELEFAHNIMIIKDNLILDNYEKYVQFVSSNKIDYNPIRIQFTNSAYVTVILLTYETIIIFLSKYISVINLYYTILQSIYFFIAKFYYKRYILNILIDKIDLNKLNINETIDREKLKSFSFKSYLLSSICLNRCKKKNNGVLIYESLSSELDNILEMKNILKLNN